MTGSRLLSVLVGRERQRDRQVARALADGVARPMRARPEALERRPLVGVDLLDVQVVADEVVVVLRVRDRGLEQRSSHARRRAGVWRGSRAPRRRTCRARGRRPGAPCARRSARTCAWARTTGAARRCGASLGARRARAVRGLLGRGSASPAARFAPGGRLRLRPRSAGARLLGLGSLARRLSRRRLLGRLRARGFSALGRLALRALGLCLGARLRLRPASRPSRRRLSARRLSSAASALVRRLRFVRSRPPSRSSRPCPSRHGRGTCASARTRRACGRPSTR